MKSTISDVQKKIKVGTHGEDYGSWMSNPVFYVFGGIALVTLVLTGVFAYMAVVGKISQDFMTIYAVIIAFYFGTQSQKIQDAVDEKGGGEA